MMPSPPSSSASSPETVDAIPCEPLALKKSSPVSAKPIPSSNASVLSARPKGFQRKVMVWTLALSVIPVLAVGITTIIGHQVLHHEAQSQLLAHSEEEQSAIPLRSAQTFVLIGTGVIAIGAGAIAAILAQRVVQPLLAAASLTTVLTHPLRRDSSQGRIADDLDEMAVLTSNLTFMERQLPQLLSQVEAAGKPLHMFMDCVHRLRMAQEEADILQIGVAAARNAIQAERVVILGFNAEGAGTVIAESVAPDWPQLLWTSLPDPRFESLLLAQEQTSEVLAMDDIYDAELTDSHLDLLEFYEIKADLITSIFKAGKLFGVLIAHQCSSSRLWQTSELTLWAQLALQIGLSLEQTDALGNASAIASPEQEMAPLLQQIWSASQESDRLNTLVVAARQHLNVARAMILRVENRASSGTIIAESQIPGLAPMLGIGIDVAAWVAQEGSRDNQVPWPQVINDVEASTPPLHPNREWMKFGVKALVSVPILTQEQLFGYLVVHQCSGPRAWQPIEIDFLVQLAHQGGWAIAQETLVHQHQTLKRQVADFLQQSGNTLADLTTAAFDQTHGVDKIYEKIQTLSEVSPPLNLDQSQHYPLVQDLHQAVQEGHHTLDQLSENLSAVHNAILEAALTAQCLDQPVQALDSLQTKVNHLVAQLKLQAMKITLEATRGGNSGQGFAAIGEQVHTLTQQLSLDLAQLQPVVSTLTTGIQDAVAQITLGQQHISTGRRLGSTLKQRLTQLLTYPDQVDTLIDRLTQTLAEQAQQSTATGQTVVELAHLTSQISELSAAIAAAHEQLATLISTARSSQG